MEPFENDELSDRELDSMLRAWEAPGAPARLREAVFRKVSRPWWRASFRVPVPVAGLLAAIVLFVVWRAFTIAPRVEIRTERIEVPVVKKEVVTKTVYRDRVVRPKPLSSELRPVAELRPIIIRSQHEQN